MTDKIAPTFEWQTSKEVIYSFVKYKKIKFLDELQTAKNVSEGVHISKTSARQSRKQSTWSILFNFPTF